MQKQQNKQDARESATQGLVLTSMIGVTGSSRLQIQQDEDDNGNPSREDYVPSSTSDVLTHTPRTSGAEIMLATENIKLKVSELNELKSKMDGMFKLIIYLQNQITILKILQLNIIMLKAKAKYHQILNVI